MNSFGEKEAWAYSGTAQILRVSPIISGTGKATHFKFVQYIQRVHPNKSTLKILEKREHGRIQGLPNFGGTPIISGTGKATDFKFGQYIWRVHLIKSPLKIFREKGAWAYPGTAQFFGYPLLSQEREKLRIPDLASTFGVSTRIKAHEKFWRKGSVGVSSVCPNFWVSPIISGTGKATYFKFGPYIQRVHPNKIPLKILKKMERGRIQGLPNFFRVPPIISGTAKAAIFKFCTHIYRLNGNKSPLKISGKVAMGIVKDSRKFSGHPYIWHIARSSLR